ncbi:hypothetical protein QYF36_004961 [Acer negundo]|nr:hypothetical protein QYF36_004961 [Acer negundo]
MFPIWIKEIPTPVNINWVDRFLGLKILNLQPISGKVASPFLKSGNMSHPFVGCQMQGANSITGGRSDNKLVKRKLHNNRVASVMEGVREFNSQIPKSISSHQKPSQKVPKPEKIAQVKGATDSRVCLRPNRKLAKAGRTILPLRSHQ